MTQTSHVVSLIVVIGAGGGVGGWVAGWVYTYSLCMTYFFGIMAR